MTFERKQRSQSVSLPPSHCGTCPDRQCAVCSRLLVIAPDLAYEFSNLARRIKYVPDEDLSDGRGFHKSISVIVSGVAMLSGLLADGRRQIAAFRFPGEPVALGGMIPTDGTTSAMTDVEICRIDGDRLDAFIGKHPQVGKSLVDLSSRQMNDLLNHVVLLGRLDAAERMAAFLVDCADRYGAKSEDGVALSLPMNRTQIADHLGINTETVSRQFSRLKENGLVEALSPSRLVISELDDLRRMVPVLTPQLAGV